MESISLHTSTSANLQVFSCREAPYPWNNNKIKSSSFARIACRSHGSAGSEKNAPVSSVNALPKTKAASRILSVTTSEESLAMPLVPPEVTIRNNQGIGIVQFLQGKNYLITGATGFLGKVFLEKLVRETSPTAGKIYLMIKAADKEAAAKRLQTEIIDSEVFGCLKQMYGDSYEVIMRRKLVPVVGDADQPNLGMDADSAAEIANEVDVIVNSAANTTFDERYDVAINTNINGPHRLLNLAKMCKNLKVFVHVSTAYANGEGQGIFTEKPFMMGDSIAAEKTQSDGGQTSLQPLDIDAEINMVSKVQGSTEKAEMTQKMKQLGLERAKLYGRRNTYEFTKTMAEMLLNSNRGDIPIVIIRPTIIEGTLAEPVPGWVQGNRMIDPIFAWYGKGHLPALPYDPETVADVVPADCVVNATLTAMAKHGIQAKPGLHIYHISSSVTNPLNARDMFRYSLKYFATNKNVIPGRTRLMELQACTSMEKFMSYMVDFSKHEVSKLATDQAAIKKNAVSTKKLEALQKKRMDQVLNLVKWYLPYLFNKGRFDNSVTQGLIPEMSHEERCLFGFDLEGLDWENYFVNVHLPGLMKYVLKK